MQDKVPYVKLKPVFVKDRHEPLHSLSNRLKIVAVFLSVISVVTLIAGLTCIFSLLPSINSDVSSQVLMTSETQPFTTTKCGPIVGGIEQGVYVFKGIPYAKPPIKDLRWKAPVALEKETGSCWKGTFNAGQFRESCVQTNFFNRTDITGNEECLYLNVWTPTLESGDTLPVMVWIHGGDLEYGYGHISGYSPTPELAKSTNIVYVSMNYRLNAFGFMTLDLLSEESDTGTSGNYGFMDQILVLKWVQDNIRNFGGDPDKITVFGHSSGATSVFALLASPLSRGLFHRAWVMSPSAILNKTSQDASRDNKIFLTKTGCMTTRCLRSLPAIDIIRAIPWDVYPYWSLEDLFDLPTKGRFDGALAVIDGHVLPESPLEAWHHGRANDVPVIIGSTGQELSLIPPDPHIHTWTWSHYLSVVKQKLKPFGLRIAAKALDLYSPSSLTTPEYRYTTMATDVRATCPIDVMTGVADTHFRSPVFRYIALSWPSRPVKMYHLHEIRYAFHGWDAFAFFGSIPLILPNPGKADSEFTKNIRREIIAFVQTGKPLSSNWLRYAKNTALIGNKTVVVSSYNRRECDFWIKAGFFSYAWIN